MAEIIKPAMENYKRHILVCIGDKCNGNINGLDLFNELKNKLAAAGLDKGETRIIRNKAVCLGICQSGPIVCIQPDGIWYYNVTSDKLDRIINEHLVAGNPVREWVFHENPVSQKISDQAD